MNLGKYLFSLETRRKRLLKRAPAGPLREFLSVPTPDPGIDHRNLKYLALDFETTGLESSQHDILSAGYLTIQHSAVLLGTSRHEIVAIKGLIPEASAVIHRITDDQAAQGLPLETVVSNLLAELAGKVMVAHHADIEFGFLNAACKKLWGCGIVMPVSDTLALEKRLMEYSGRPMRPGALRLNTVRERYGLPRYGAHNALTDALACAELFLAQCEYRSRGKRMNLELLLHRL
jgi:DNA polymerase-3 subunit epsilon